MADAWGLEDYESDQGGLDARAGGCLRAKGWKHTSSTPGCYWMWTREIGGITYMVDLAVAIRIQRHLDEDAS